MTEGHGKAHSVGPRWKSMVKEVPSPVRNTECSSLGAVRHFRARLPLAKLFYRPSNSRTQFGLVKPHWRAFRGQGKEDNPVVDTFLASWSDGWARERSVFISWCCCHHRHHRKCQSFRLGEDGTAGFLVRRCGTALAG